MELIELGHFANKSYWTLKKIDELAEAFKQKRIRRETHTKEPMLFYENQTNEDMEAAKRYIFDLGGYRAWYDGIVGVKPVAYHAELDCNDMREMLYGADDDEHDKILKRVKYKTYDCAARVIFFDFYEAQVGWVCGLDSKNKKLIVMKLT